MRLLEFPPPNIGAMRRDDLYAATLAKLDELIALFTQPAPGAAQAAAAAVPAGQSQGSARDIVFSGDLRAANDFFLKNI